MQIICTHKIPPVSGDSFFILSNQNSIHSLPFTATSSFLPLENVLPHKPSPWHCVHVLPVPPSLPPRPSHPTQAVWRETQTNGLILLFHMAHFFQESVSVIFLSLVVNFAAERGFLRISAWRVVVARIFIYNTPDYQSMSRQLKRVSEERWCAFYRVMRSFQEEGPNCQR